MRERSEIRADLVRLLELPEESVDLGRAALLVAEEANPRCDIEAYLRRLDEWGETLAGHLTPGWNNLQKLARLRDFMFEKLRFQGDRRSYHSPANALLDQVMDRRLGIPLTLSIVFMELGRRIGVPFEGVGFPGHFLVRLTGEPADLLLDPFSHAQSVHEEDCRRMLEESSGGRVSYSPELLARISKRDMIARLLANLKNAYLRAEDDSGALAAVERLLLVHPEDAAEIRDRGLLLYRLERRADALAELRRYLELAPDGRDREVVQRHVAVLRAYLERLN